MGVRKKSALIKLYLFIGEMSVMTMDEFLSICKECDITVVGDEEEIWSLAELKKHCKNMIETYRQFTLYKKQFSENKRIVKMKKDFE